MIVFGIFDSTNNVWWSRNRWGTKTSIPDLYQTRLMAEKQIKEGKISIGVGYRDMTPVIVEFDLLVRH